MQATMTVSNSYQRGRMWPTLILLCAIAFAVALSVHAIAKHGSAAYTAAQCADKPELRMINPENGRIAMICLTSEGWGIYIQEADGSNVTAFVKEKVSRIEQVIRYMRNRGYELLQ